MTAIELIETIKHEGDKWVIYSADGSKKLGEYDTEEEAKKRLAQIEFFKHQKESMAVFSEAEGVKFVIGFKKEGGSEVQSVIFDKVKWTVEKAKAWLKDHDMKAPGVDETEDSLRFRQEDPEKFERFRIMEPGKTKESALDTELLGDTVPLVEKAVRKDGTVLVKIIQPGWGTSGYYSPDVLKRDGPKVFPKGTKMFIDHPTPHEESERPERSLLNLGGALATDARWEDNGPSGAGLYSEATTFLPWKTSLDELAPYIGVSIRALGKVKQGEAEGRKGNLVEQIMAARSVDFVTTPGAGGRILQLFESARHVAPEGGDAVDEKEAKELKEANAALALDKARLETEGAAKDAEIVRLKEVIVLKDSEAFLTEALSKIELSPVTRTRLHVALGKEPPVKDGILDKDAYAITITEAAKAELAYLASVTPPGGKIVGMGGNPPAPQDGAVLAESFKRLYRAQGMNDAEATKLAEGAARR